MNLILYLLKFTKISWKSIQYEQDLFPWFQVLLNISNYILLYTPLLAKYEAASLTYDLEKELESDFRLSYSEVVSKLQWSLKKIHSKILKITGLKIKVFLHKQEQSFSVNTVCFNHFWRKYVDHHRSFSLSLMSIIWFASPMCRFEWWQKYNQTNLF